MLAMSPHCVQISEFARWLDQDDDPMRNQQMMMTESSKPLILDPHHPHCHDQSSRGEADACLMNDLKAAKKLRHNANERDRRKRITYLFSYLRSLLPLGAHPRKKMSIPETIRHVLKYIPELQHVVQRLTRRKEQLWLSQKRLRDSGGNLSSVRSTRIGNGDVLFQICAERATMISVVLAALEQEDGLLLVNASSFQSRGRTSNFFTLHFKVGQSCKLECEVLTKKLLSL